MLRRTLSTTCRNAAAHASGSSPANSAASDAKIVMSEVMSKLDSKPAKRSPANADRPWKSFKRFQGAREHTSLPPEERQLRTLAGQQLRPAVLSSRVKLLCREGAFAHAFTLLKESPIRLETPIPWNMLISQAMKAKKYSFAYDVYIEMKRRGLKPNLATYMTMLAGYADVLDWKTNTKQLAHCHAVYDSFFINRNEPEVLPLPGAPRVNPTSKYMVAISRAGLHDKLLDVLNSMDTDGPWAPDAILYGALLSCLRYRENLKGVLGLSTAERNASDAKLLWRQIKAAENRGTLVIDDYLVSRVINLLSRGRPADRQLALDIAKEYAGFAIPGEDALPVKVELSPDTRLSILHLLRRMGRSRLVMDYSTMLLKTDAANMGFYAHHILQSFNEIAVTAPSDESEKSFELLQSMFLESISRGDKSLRPVVHYYETALMTCWRCSDWPTACKIFTMMTGYDAHTFEVTLPKDTNLSSQERKIEETAKVEEKTLEKNTMTRAKRSEGLNNLPSNLAMLNIIRTALASKDKAAMLQCWEIYSYFFGLALPKSADWTAAYSRAAIHAPYYNVTFARAIVDLTDHCTPLVKASRVMDMKRLAQLAKKTAAMSGTNLLVPTMERITYEGEGEGEASRLKEAIDFELQLRNE